MQVWPRRKQGQRGNQEEPEACRRRKSVGWGRDRKSSDKGRKGRGGPGQKAPVVQSRQGKEIPHSTSLGPTQIRQ